MHNKNYKLREAATMSFLASIRGRLILLVLLLVLPAAALVYSTALHNRELLLAETRQRLNIAAHQASNDLQEVIRDARSLYFALSLAPAIRTQSEPECSRILAETLARMPDFATIIVTDRNGQGHCSALPVNRPLPAYGDREYFKKCWQPAHWSLICRYLAALHKGLFYPSRGHCATRRAK